MKEKIKNIFKTIKTKTKNMFSSIKKFISKQENAGIMILGVLILIFLVFAAIYLIGTKNISSIEEKALREKSNDLMLYIEDITLSESNDIDKYIIYALDYSYNKSNKNDLSCEEITNFIKENFTIDTDIEKIRNMGVSPLMLEKNITYEPATDSYKMNIIKKSPQTIKDEPIFYYKLEKISKKNKKKYVITYKKYIIENPENMLNYYMEVNNNTEGVPDDNGNMRYDLIDTTPIVNYLLGSGKTADIKNLIKEEYLSSFAKEDKKGEIKVTYIIKDDKLLIDKYK